MLLMSDSERMTTSLEKFYKKCVISCTVLAYKYGRYCEAVSAILIKSVTTLFRTEPLGCAYWRNSRSLIRFFFYFGFF